MANSTFISLPVTSGGGSSYTFTSPLVNTGGTVSLGIVPLALGGAGGSLLETTVSTSGTFTNLAVPTNIIRFTNSGPVSIDGIVSDGTNKSVTIISEGTGNITIFHNNGAATAANRIICPNNNALVLQGGHDSVTFYYDLNTSRWYPTSFNIAAGVSPGYVNVSTQQFSGAKGFQNGIRLPSISNTSVLFIDQSGQENVVGSTKLTYNDGTSNGTLTTGSYVSKDTLHGQVVFPDSSQQFRGSNDLFWDDQNSRLGIQTALPEASVHSKSNAPVTPQLPGSFTSMEVSLPILPEAVLSASIQVIATLADTPATAYNATGVIVAQGQTITFNFYTFLAGQVIDGITFNGFTNNFSQVTYTDLLNDGSTFSVDVTWNPYMGDSVDIQVDDGLGSGFATEKSFNNLTSSVNYNDDFVTISNIPPLPLLDAYAAVGTTRNYNGYQTAVDANGTTYASQNPDNYTVTDDGLGDTYIVIHLTTDASSLIIGAIDGVSADSHVNLATSSFVETPSVWIPGNTVPPYQVGYISDSIVRDYRIYSGLYTPSGPIVSSTFSTTSLTDNGTSGDYGVQLNWGAPTSDFYYILNQVNGAGFNQYTTVTATTLLDDNLFVWTSGSPTLTPNNFYIPAAKFEGPFADTSLTATTLASNAIIKSSLDRYTDSAYAKLSFNDLTGQMGYIQVDQNGMHFYNPSAIDFSLSGGASFSAINTSILNANTLQVSSTALFQGGTTFQNAATFGPGGSFTVYDSGFFNLGVNVVGTSNFSGHGRVSFDGSVLNLSYQTATPTTGTTVTCAGVLPGLVLTPAGTLATLTIKLPSSAVNGQLYWVASTQIITAVTWQDSGGTAANVIGGKSSIGGTGTGQGFIFIGGSVNKWLSNS